MNDNMCTFKERLDLKSDRKVLPECRIVKWRDINSVHDDIEELSDDCTIFKMINGKNIRSKHKNKSKRHNHTMHLFDEMHDEMKMYWQSFGFLNKSFPLPFAYSILPAMKIGRYYPKPPVFDADIDFDE